ncbi:hypothetical protein GCM10008107_10230 [Psychrosphaera saromensis]|uniref:FlgO domain-containing protein n=1 Tax=Psychrosphaera saromensis TaxID=716813 RepID=A0A2S7UUR6_9GAMM|nr:FlgO family outer membrane protein [Psychrosphaera saromensis]PQJ53697.1 hypothetical protein BTO11_08475 [Psychrosphaera saromensis]GHB63085.1 hypothetical protein GCM10008107_10230 [Psychrosphaera saromensis]GLQ15526.1 hypothetical protein GCM10007917_29810 [Psychrosphaera saromensis]
MKLLLLLIVMHLLVGCVAAGYHNEHNAGRFKQFGYGFITEDEAEHANVNLIDSKILKAYADRLAFEMTKQVNPDKLGLMTVTSFVELDDNLNNTNPLGNQLSDTLLISLKEVGFFVEDLYTASDVQITDKGAFVFSRTIDKLRKLESEYILSGVINYTPNSVNINARVINIKQSEIVAAHSFSIPNYIVRSSYPIVDGVDIIIKGK